MNKVAASEEMADRTQVQNENSTRSLTDSLPCLVRAGSMTRLHLQVLMRHAQHYKKDSVHTRTQATSVAPNLRAFMTHICAQFAILVDFHLCSTQPDANTGNAVWSERCAHMKTTSPQLSLYVYER